jgi:hypothetical protein
MIIRESVIERFNSFDLNTDSCINYPILNKSGYGVMQTYLYGNKKHYLMHRVSYQLIYNVNLNSSQIICHKCDNPSCINPKHLFLGTHADNVEDKVLKGRQAKGSNNARYTTGEYTKEAKIFKKENPKINYKRVLSIGKVIEIKNLIKNKILSLKEISENTGISYSTVRDISSNRIYKNI